MSLDPRQWGGRPVWAEIDLDAVAHNVKLLAARARPARLFAVVKANAYGHGAAAVGRASLAAGADALVVVCLDEAEDLRRAGITAPLIVIGHTPASEAARALELRVELALGGMELAEALSAEAVRRRAEVSVHLELETGLNRHGLLPDAAVAVAERVRTLPGVRLRALFTHFAAAEEGDQAFTRAQFGLLREVSRRLPWVLERHCSASASLLLDPEMSMEAVRVGLSLYGYRPAPWCGTDVELRPVLSLRSRVARLQEVGPGATIGYGRSWTARRPSRIALVMCGYADGYRRGFGNRAQVLVRGHRVPVVGRVAMDMCMADVTEVPGAGPGDVVTLLGSDGGERVDADELAALGDTISWEILSGVTARVPRLFLRDGVAVEVTTLAQPVPRPP